MMKETHFYARPSALAVTSAVLIAILLVSTSCSLCHKPTEIPDEHSATEEHIMIECLVFKSSDNGAELTSFLEEEGIAPLARSRGMSAILTTTQQGRFKTLSHFQKVASPTTHAKDGKVAKLSVIIEEYFVLDPDSYPHEVSSVESGLMLEVTPHLQEAEHEMILNINLEISSTTPSPKSILPIVTKSTARNTCRLDRNTGILLMGQSHGDDPPLSILITARKVRLTKDLVEPTE